MYIEKKINQKIFEKQLLQFQGKSVKKYHL